MPPPTEQEVLAFIAASIPSVWALQTLVMLKESPTPGRRIQDLVNDLRSSEPAVRQGLKKLQQAGLIIELDGTFRYSPASPALAQLAEALAVTYAQKPVAVVNAIVGTVRDNLQIFADSFRLKE